MKVKSTAPEVKGKEKQIVKNNMLLFMIMIMVTQADHGRKCTISVETLPVDLLHVHQFNHSHTEQKSCRSIDSQVCRSSKFGAARG